MRPSISLACILKNEVNNLPRLLTSVKDCFDEIHLTDTGSNDGSIELIKKYMAGENPANTKIFLHHFEWISDFEAARTYSFSHPKTDYIMWLDLDDVLNDAQSFIGWRDNVLALGDFWLATYHYSLNSDGKPMCSFARERIVKRDLSFSWRYPVHEGMLPKSHVKKDVILQYATTWSVNHLRSADDLAQDRSRNLRIFESQTKLCPRMQYYYGKELFENQRPLEGFTQLMNAITASAQDLELHDRIMGIQYACLCAMTLNQFEKAVDLAHKGMQLAPQRAEFFIIAGDCYMKMNKPIDAIPMYTAASNCRFDGAGLMQGPIFSFEDSYKHYPLNQLARIFANLGDLEKAKAYVIKALGFGPNPETEGINKDIEMISQKIGDITIREKRTKTSDIVISCPPQGLYEWDGDVYRTTGIGGSETAAIEVSEWLSKLSGRKVIIFNKRAQRKIINGVEYWPSQEIAEYFRDYSPALHIAWRHVTRLSDDPYYVWCHDLAAPGIEAKDSNHKILALSEFHKTYLKHMFSIDGERILITSNGVDPTRFNNDKEKEIGKVIYSSSPDRGLERAMKVMDEVIKTHPEATLHVYYGFDNMYKMGMREQADHLHRMMGQRSYVKFHGNLPQSELTKEFKTACIWLYPTSFLETYCITAIEAICSGVYPIVRKWGALPYTLKKASKNDMASVYDCDCETEEEIKNYASLVNEALTVRLWERVKVNPDDYSWKKVAEQWINELLPVEESCQTRFNSSRRQ